MVASYVTGIDNRIKRLESEIAEIKTDLKDLKQITDTRLGILEAFRQSLLGANKPTFKGDEHGKSERTNPVRKINDASETGANTRNVRAVFRETNR
jgi:hypothetical protein